MNRKPRAVLISDVHYSLANLALAEASMHKAIVKARELGVPLIVAGDLHDSKANIRGECANAMIKTFKWAEETHTATIVLIGNHDKISEKDHRHSLEFLRPYCLLVQSPVIVDDLGFIPYQSSPEAFAEALKTFPEGSTVIMHQGVQEADMGEYVVDHSAVSSELLAHHRCISGHYHKAQDIKCGRPQKGAAGLMSYIGTPYTVTFAEANDGPKGFQILYDDGLLEQVPTNLRKHVIAEVNVEDLPSLAIPGYAHGDLLWLKIKGSYSELERIDRRQLIPDFGATFKLDKIITSGKAIETAKITNESPSKLLDMIIEQSSEKEEAKLRLKRRWRELM